MNKSSQKETLLFALTLLSFIADVLSIVAFLASGQISPLIIVGFTSLFGIFLLAVTVDYIANNSSYPKLRAFIEFAIKNKSIGTIALCVASAVAGFVFIGFIVSLWYLIAQPDLTDPITREETAMGIATTLGIGTLLCGLSPFLLLPIFLPFFLISTAEDIRHQTWSKRIDSYDKVASKFDGAQSQTKQANQYKSSASATILSHRTRYHQDENRAIVSLEINSEIEQEGYFIDIQYIVLTSNNIRDVRNIRKVIKNIPKGTFPIEFVITLSSGEFLIEKTVKIVEFKKHIDK